MGNAKLRMDSLKKNLWIGAALAMLLPAGCERESDRVSVAESYERLARPEVWEVLPHGQAQAAGLGPGDVVVSYDGVGVRTNDEVRLAQARAIAGVDGDSVTVAVMREGRTRSVRVVPGPLGVMPVSARYPSSLAVALEALLRESGRFADYDWLVALTGEAFTFTARGDECRAWWPGGKSGVYVEQSAAVAGLSVRRIEGEDVARGVERALRRGRAVLVQGGWPEHRFGFWGVAARYDAGDSLGNRESGIGVRGSGPNPETRMPNPVIYGYVMDAPDEVPVSGEIVAAYEVGAGGSWAEPEEVFAAALRQALELTQVHADTGWKSGVEAYDLVIASLDSVPFCPVCGEEESQACWDRLIWATLAHRESGRRFLEQMKLGLPDQLVLVEEAITVNDAIIAKLRGILFSSTRLGTKDEQQKLALVLNRVQIDEVRLIEIYEALLGALAR